MENIAQKLEAHAQRVYAYLSHKANENSQEVRDAYQKWYDADEHIEANYFEAYQEAQREYDPAAYAAYEVAEHYCRLYCCVQD